MTWFKPNPKTVTFYNEDYLKWIRNRPCCFPFCGMPAEPHHFRRSYYGAGAGKKPSDYVTIPLCRTHHDPRYEKDILVERIIIKNLMEYIESKRKNRV